MESGSIPMGINPKVWALAVAIANVMKGYDDEEEDMGSIMQHYAKVRWH